MAYRQELQFLAVREPLTFCGRGLSFLFCNNNFSFLFCLNNAHDARSLRYEIRANRILRGQGKLTNKPNILLVDDEPLVLDALRQIAAREGRYCPASAENGKIALEMTQKETYSVVIRVCILMCRFSKDRHSSEGWNSSLFKNLQMPDQVRHDKKLNLNTDSNYRSDAQRYYRN